MRDQQKIKGINNRQLFNPLDYLSINPAVLDVFTYLVKQRTNNTAKAAYNLLAYKKTCHTFTNKLAKRQNKPSAATSFFKMVGTGRVELPTSRLSVVRSNHLSYAPVTLVYLYL